MTTATALAKLPKHKEQDPDFVYVIYIKTTPQKLWDALTDNKTARAWWAGTRMDSTFKPGASLSFMRQSNGKADVEGEILEAEPPRRLVYTFHVSGPGPQHDEGATLVEYSIETDGEAVRLTVTHSNLKKDSRVRVGVSKGWVHILSSLKSVLEGGEPLQYAEWGRK